MEQWFMTWSFNRAGDSTTRKLTLQARRCRDNVSLKQETQVLTSRNSLSLFAVTAGTEVDRGRSGEGDGLEMDVARSELRIAVWSLDGRIQPEKSLAQNHICVWMEVWSSLIII